MYFNPVKIERERADMLTNIPIHTHIAIRDALEKKAIGGQKLKEVASEDASQAKTKSTTQSRIYSIR